MVLDSSGNPGYPSWARYLFSLYHDISLEVSVSAMNRFYIFNKVGYRQKIIRFVTKFFDKMIHVLI